MSLHLNSVWKVWTRASGRGPFLYDKKYRFDDIFLFYLMYTLYNAVLTITIFFQRIYTMGLKISLSDTAKAVIVCILHGFHRLREAKEPVGPHQESQAKRRLICEPLMERWQRQVRIVPFSGGCFSRSGGLGK